MLLSIYNFVDQHSGYILATIFLLGGLVKETLNFKQRKVNRLETEAKLKKANLEYSDALRDSYKETAAEWQGRYEEEKKINSELIQANKIAVENLVKEQQTKTEYLEELHKLREEVKELKEIIITFQKQFPDLFSTVEKVKSIK